MTTLRESQTVLSQEQDALTSREETLNTDYQTRLLRDKCINANLITTKPEKVKHRISQLYFVLETFAWNFLLGKIENFQVSEILNEGMVCMALLWA